MKPWAIIKDMYIMNCKVLLCILCTLPLPQTHDLFNTHKKSEWALVPDVVYVTFWICNVIGLLRNFYWSSTLGHSSERSKAFYILCTFLLTTSKAFWTTVVWSCTTLPLCREIWVCLMMISTHRRQLVNNYFLTKCTYVFVKHDCCHTPTLLHTESSHFD